MPVTEAFYEAAVIPELWRSALNLASSEWDADGAALVSYPDCSGGLINTEGLDELCARYIEDEWFKHDIRAARGLAPEQGRPPIVTDLDLFTLDELERLPFYSDFLYRQGFGWFAGCKLAETGGVSISLSLQRRVGRLPFSQDELAKIEHDLPHLKRAAQLASRSRLAYAEGVVDSLAGFESGAILIDRLGRVIRMNKQAETYLGYHLHVVASRLRAPHHETNGFLQELIAGMQGSALARTTTSLTSILLPRKNNLPLLVQSYPIVRQASDIFQGASGLLLISDLTQSHSLNSQLLREVFQLTPAELRVASSLFLGMDTQQIATQHQVGTQTVRFHLKSIFAKTDTSHQAQLVSLMARFTAHHL